VLLDLQQQRLERGIGAELTATANIIKRSGVFDEVDSKYGIPEEEREKLEASGGANTAPEGGGMGGMGGGGAIPPPPAGGEAGGEGPLSESTKKKRNLSEILDEDPIDFSNVVDMKKAQDSIYEMEQKLKDILND
jgi:hypothetical protein